MKFANEAKVGVTVVISIIVLFFGMRYMQDIPLFRGSYELHTQFDAIDGLLRGNVVSIAGVNVGSISAVKLDMETRSVNVRLRIDRDVEIPRGTVARAAGMPPVVPARIELDLGPPGAPLLEDGDFIEGARQPDLITSFTERIDPLFADIDTMVTQTSMLIRALGSSLAHPQGDLQQSLQNLRASTATFDQMLRGEQHRISSVLANLDTFSTEMSEFAATNRDTLTRAIQTLNATLNQVEANLASVEDLTGSLNNVAQRIERGDGTLGLMVNDPRLYHQLDSLTHSLNRLLDDFQESPREYLRHLRLFSIF